MTAKAVIFVIILSSLLGNFKKKLADKLIGSHSALFALFSAQIVFAAEGQSDLRIVLVASLLRIGLLAFTALRGYMVGERTILCDTVGYLDAKSDFLDSFSTWAAKHQTSHA